MTTTIRNDPRSLLPWRYLPPDDWVFPSESGETRLWANNLWYHGIRPTLQRVGLRWVNYQALRRSAVSPLNALGSGGAIVAAQIGHTPEVSLNTYNQVGIERQQAEVPALHNALKHPLQRAARLASHSPDHCRRLLQLGGDGMGGRR